MPLIKITRDAQDEALAFFMFYFYYLIGTGGHHDGMHRERGMESLLGFVEQKTKSLTGEMSGKPFVKLRRS